MVVTQLAERSPKTPEVHSSNPDIGKFLRTFTVEKTKLKKKRPEWPIKILCQNFKLFGHKTIHPLNGIRTMVAYV